MAGPWDYASDTLRRILGIEPETLDFPALQEQAEAPRPQFEPRLAPTVTQDMVRHGGGSIKGPGWLGSVPTSGGHMTELSVGLDWGHGETQIPLLVPGLTQSQVNRLANGEPPDRGTLDLAKQHAVERIQAGKSPFRSHKEPQGKMAPPMVYTPGTLDEVAARQGIASDDPGQLSGLLEAWRRAEMIRK